MTFYNLSEEMGNSLKIILNKLSNKERDYPINCSSITWINYQKINGTTKRIGYGLNSNQNIYPASIVKLAYGLATYKWIEQGKLQYSEDIRNAVYKMLYFSSNDATSYIVDLLSGTTSGLSLNGNSWKDWKYQRSIINDWLKELNWDELQNINCCQKTWEDGPYGREKDFYGINNQNINLMSTDGTARIMEEIMKNLSYEAENVNLIECLSRSLSKDLIKKDPLNQIEGFLGEGLPENTKYWSKAGLMSKVRHDAAWWKQDEFNDTLLVVFGNGNKFVEDKSFLPKLAYEVFHVNQKFINLQESYYQ